MQTKLKQPIFRVGQSTSQQGYEHNYTEEEVRKICESYDPLLHKAPVQIGHVSTSSPAYGWIEALEYNPLRKTIDAVVSYAEEVVELIKNQAYKFCSASFYPADSDYNPIKGSFYLRSLALLGAEPPAIKGLGEISFSEAEVCDCVVVDRLPEDSWYVEEISREVTQGIKTNLELDLELKESEIVDLKRQIKGLELAQARDKISQQVEQLYQKGNMTTGLIQAEDLVNLLFNLRYGDEAYSYSEGNSSYDTLLGLLNKIQTVSYSELTVFNEPMPTNATPHEKALEIVKTQGIRYRDALRSVTGG